MRPRMSVCVHFQLLTTLLWLSVFRHGLSIEVTTEVTIQKEHCQDPGLPDNAIRTPPVGVGTFFVGAKVRYTCEEGYKLKGSSILQCVAGGAWFSDDENPSCVLAQPCEVPLNHIPYAEFHGNDFTDETRSSVRAGGFLNITCHQRHYLSDETLGRNLCEKNGKWAYMWPECLALCPPPSPIQSGYFTASQTPVGNYYKGGAVLTYGCMRGYNLIGNNKLICSDGQWGPTPHCERDCSVNPPDIENGDYIIHGELGDGENEYRSGSLATYHCDRGYAISISSDTLHCSNGEWRGVLPTCSVEGCDLQPIPHGSVLGIMQSPFPLFEVVTYACDQGYEMQGCLEVSFSENHCQRKCLSSGHWSGPMPVCVPRNEVDHCEDPGEPEHGQRCCQDRFQPGDKVSFYCDEGFYRQGSPERICSQDGTWTGTQALCFPVNSNVVTSQPQSEGIFLTNTTLTIVIATTGTILGILIIIILLSLKKCHYRSRRLSRSLPIHHSHRRTHFMSPTDIDRVALIAYANGLEVVLPSYEEATAEERPARPPSFSESFETSDNNNSGHSGQHSSQSSPPPQSGAVDPTSSQIQNLLSQFRRLPRIPRSLRAVPPSTVTMFMDQRENQSQGVSTTGRRNSQNCDGNEVGVQTHSRANSPSARQRNEVESMPVDFRVSDTAALLQLENEISRMSAEQQSAETIQDSNNIDADYVELLTDLTEEDTDKAVSTEQSVQPDSGNTIVSESSTTEESSHHEDLPSNQN